MLLKRANPAKIIPVLLYSALLLILLVYEPYREMLNNTNTPIQPIESFKIDQPEVKKSNSLFVIVIQENIKMRDYFSYLDSLVCQYDSLTPYPMDEHLLVKANDWIIDTLANTDYYHRMKKGEFVYDQRELVILNQGDRLTIPNVETAATILGKRLMVHIDLNIPEFKLRIIEAGKTIHTFPVRVGRNEVKYLAMAKRKVDLRTTPGAGKIVRLNRYPSYINPVNGKKYEQTKRDDDKYTKMPLIPYIEPEIDGHRYGELIHPTTNPETLGKAYSNGCVGLGEADSWRLYYYSPLETKVIFRYDLEVINEDGEPELLEDIYNTKMGLASAINFLIPVY